MGFSHLEKQITNVSELNYGDIVLVDANGIYQKNMSGVVNFIDTKTSKLTGNSIIEIGISIFEEDRFVGCNIHLSEEDNIRSYNLRLLDKTHPRFSKGISDDSKGVGAIHNSFKKVLGDIEDSGEGGDILANALKNMFDSQLNTPTNIEYHEENITDLQRKLNIAVENENYEEAAIIKKEIDKRNM